MILAKLLGDDGAIYKGAKVGTEVDLNKDSSWVIDKVYFQPKGSNYFVEINLEAGTVGEAVKINDKNKMPNASFELK